MRVWVLRTESDDNGSEVYGVYARKIKALERAGKLLAEANKTPLRKTTRTSEGVAVWWFDATDAFCVEVWPWKVTP